MQPTALPVLIAGGGIAGLAAALALAQKGQASVVYERAAHFSELGAGVQLGPNAVGVLRALGLQADLQAIACQPQALQVRAVGSGAALSRMVLGAAMQQRHGLPYLTAHRGQLHQLLLHAAQAHDLIALHSDTTAETYAPQEAAVELLLSQGRQALGSALLACDGVWSRLGSQIQPQQLPAEYSGHLAYRALLPMDAVRALLPAIDAEVGLWLGRGAHVVHYPVDAGRQLSLVVLLEMRQPSGEQGWNTPIAPERVQAALQQTLGGGYAPALQQLLGTAQHWFAWPLYSRPARSAAPMAWAQGRAAIMGDAAHPMLPYLAQGAAMALEDAQVLAQCWQGAASVPAALQAYAAERQGRCTRVVQTAARNARIFHASGAVALGRNAYLRWRDGKPVGMDWLYGWRA